jgi:hypothetical protein
MLGSGRKSLFENEMTDVSPEIFRVTTDIMEKPKKEGKSGKK